MKKSIDQLVSVISAGSSVSISAIGRSTDQLARLAAVSAGKEKQITITNAGEKSTDQLVRIAASGRGFVSFEFNE